MMITGISSRVVATTPEQVRRLEEKREASIAWYAGVLAKRAAQRMAHRARIEQARRDASERWAREAALPDNVTRLHR